MKSSISKEIITRRLKLNLTQEDLSATTGISTRTIQRIEAGEVTPRPETLKLISIALDYDFHGLPVNKRLNKTLLFFIQISNVFMFFMFPVLVLIWNNQESKDLENETKKALDFQLNALFLQVILVVVLIVYVFVVAKSSQSEAFLISVASLMAMVEFVVIIVSVRNSILLADRNELKYPVLIKMFSK